MKFGLVYVRQHHLALLALFRSKGVLGVANPGDDPRVNCFDLSFEPSNVVATPEFGSATLQLSASVTPNIVMILNCPAPFRDAVVFTYTSAGTFYASFN